jgi:hypothetical protein
MQRMIAICGLICSVCPAFTATQKDDEEEKKRIADLWSTDEYPLKPGDIHCEGCLAFRAKVMSFCEACDVRQCGFDNKVENCAHCDEFPCEKPDKIFARSPEAKAALDEIRKSH